MQKPHIRSQRFTQFIAAPPNLVYRALLDPRLIERWRVPDGMRAKVHEFDPRTGGRFRVSLTYEEPGPAGKTSEHTDTYHGTFSELVPDRRVVETLAFETADPAMQGEMRIVTTLDAADGGTLLVATHHNLPSGLSLSDNELGWTEALGKLGQVCTDLLQPVTVRVASEPDIPAMHDIRLRVRENRLADPEMIQLADYRPMLTTRGRGWVAELYGRIAGFAVADRTLANVWALFVDPDFEGRGLGKALHDEMMNWLFSTGVEHAWLGTEAGTRAERFYQSRGWRYAGPYQQGEVKYLLSADDWLERSGKTVYESRPGLAPP